MNTHEHATGTHITDMYHCAITGANGYLGSRLTRYCTERHWNVFRMTRSDQPQAGGRWIRFALGEAVSPDVFTSNGIKTLIHCAYDFTVIDRKDVIDTNVAGSIRLMDAAQRGGVTHIVYISSMSAYEGCRSVYGQAKLAVEAAARERGATVVRPGLIFGDCPGGMVGDLLESVRRSRIVPLIGNGDYILYLTHDEDLCRMVLKIAEGNSPLPSRPLVAANEQGKTFRDILIALAASQGTRIHFARIPWRLAWCAVRFFELSGCRIKYRSDSIVSLVHQDPRPDFSGTHALAMPFRPFAPEADKADRREERIVCR